MNATYSRLGICFNTSGGKHLVSNAYYQTVGRISKKIGIFHLRDIAIEKEVI